MADTAPTAFVAPTQISPSSVTDQSVSQPQTQPTTHPLQPSAAYPLFVLPPTLPRPPFIDVDGVPNFRSLGGYLSANGTTIVRPNLFYRCAHPTQITPEGLEFLTSKLGVRAIYDLRSGPEVARTTAGAIAAAASASAAAGETPAILTDGINTTAPEVPPIPSCSPLFESLRHFTPVYATQDTGPEALARKLKWYIAPTAPTVLPYPYSEGFVNAYRDISTHGAPAYTAMFRHILTRPQDPFVFHCTAGKDRTGVFAALLFRLAGVDDETICWEYAITEPGLGHWRTLFIDRMSGGASLHNVSSPPAKDGQMSNGESKPQPPKETMTREEAARVGGSRAGNMRAWLTLVLDGEFGGAERYLMQHCHFNEEEVSIIKQNLVIDLAVAGEDAVVRPCAVEGWTPDGGCIDERYGKA